MRKKLLILFCFIISYFSFSENIVITSTQPLYSLTTYITKDTDIKVYNAFGSETSMTMSREAINEENFDLSIAKKAQAVIDIAKIWHDDTIYRKARMNNIKIIEIDASFPYDNKVSSLFFNEFSNGKTNFYVWLGTKNLIRMANIIARDLARIYPKQKEKIEKNVIIFTNKILEEESISDSSFVNAKSLEVISLSENIHYLLNDINLYIEYENPENINAENVAEIMNKKGIKVFVSDRWLKKNVIKAIKDAGGEFVIINTLDIPMDLNGKMDPDALLKAYRENRQNLLNALSK